MRLLVVSILLFFLNYQGLGNDPVFVIEGKPYYIEDILNPLGKNITEKEVSIDQFNDALTYHLVIHDAKVKGIHEGAAFKREYRDASALAMVDRYKEEQLKSEVSFYYQRARKFVRIRELKMNFDTKLIQEIQKDIEEGYSFYEIAIKYKDEVTLSTRTIVPLIESPYLEEFAYRSKGSKMQGPFRTSGKLYYLETVNEVKNTGISRIANILIRDEVSIEKNKSQISYNRIHEIYEKLNQGADFGQLALKYSEDKSSAKNYGVLPEISPEDEILPEIEKSLSTLRINEYSEPFYGKFGWYIIKMLERREYLDKRQVREKLEKKSLLYFLERLKVKYELKEHLENLTFLQKHSANLVIFELAGRRYTVQDLFDFIGDKEVLTEATLIRCYDDFLKDEILQEHISRQGAIEEEKIGNIDAHLFFFQTASNYRLRLSRNEEHEFFNLHKNIFKRKYGDSVTFKEVQPFVNEEYRKFQLREHSRLLLESYQVKIPNKFFLENNPLFNE